MAAEKSEIDRKNSRFRRGCEEAVQGKKTLIALGTWAPVGGLAPLGKLNRTLNEAGDLNPPFTLIENILEINPAPLLDRIGQICRVRWEPIPVARAVALQEIVALHSDLAERFGELSLLIERVCENQTSARHNTAADRVRVAG